MWGYVHTGTEAMSTKWGRNPGFSSYGNVMVAANGCAPIMSVWAYDKDGKPVYNADGTRKQAGYLSPGNFVDRYHAVSGLSNDSWAVNTLRMESYLGRVNYVYDEKYYLSGSVRADGSSKFFKNKWGTFWSVGGGWRITSEKFMEGTKSWLENAKLRASYGVIGNQNGIGNYTNHTWSYGVAKWKELSNGTGLAEDVSITYGNLVNEELTWETTHTFDVGLDFALLGGRIAGTFDFYNSLTTNSFYNQPVSLLAEAQAASGSDAAAKATLDKLLAARTVAGATPLTCATYPSMAGKSAMDMVKLQWRIEMWGENGLEFWCNKRWNTTATRNGSNHWAQGVVSTEHMTLEIPRKETDNNPNW